MPDETITVSMELFNRMCNHLLDLPYRETMNLYNDITDAVVADEESKTPKIIM